MVKFTNHQLEAMSKPASSTEESKLENAQKAVNNALSKNSVLSTDIEVFGQGSYANNTNIRNNSDIDINVCYTGAFYFDIPSGTSREQYGIYPVNDYSYQQFKNDVEQILVEHFGRSNVIRKNKCIHIKENTYHAEIDVVPTWKYRRYKSNKNIYDEGVALCADNALGKIINFPKQHKQNGIQKNYETSRRYKRLVRIIKNLHIRMEEYGYYRNDHITSFLLECLVYNLPNDRYQLDRYCDWNSILRDCICYFWNITKTENRDWENLAEVSELLPLMRGHKWTTHDVNEFMLNLFNYLEY